MRRRRRAERLRLLNETRLHLPPITPIEVPAYTLVLIDTSGFHRRGAAPPGSTRAQCMTSFPVQGVERLHPFRSSPCSVNKRGGANCPSLLTYTSRTVARGT